MKDIPKTSASASFEGAKEYPPPFSIKETRTSGPDKIEDSIASSDPEKSEKQSPTPPQSQPQADSTAGVIAKLIQGDITLRIRHVATIAVLTWYIAIIWIFIRDNDTLIQFKRNDFALFTNKAFYLFFYTFILFFIESIILVLGNVVDKHKIRIGFNKPFVYLIAILVGGALILLIFHLFLNANPLYL